MFPLSVEPSTGSLFDIVDQNLPTAFPPGSAEVSRLPAGGRRAPVNFLYMGLFLGFEKIRSRMLTYA